LLQKGGGSSFDGTKYDEKAGSMNVLMRWKQIQNMKTYRKLFKDKELIGLSEKIFGHIPGTEVLYK
jgi:hypothetical protein